MHGTFFELKFPQIINGFAPFFIKLQYILHTINIDHFEYVVCGFMDMSLFCHHFLMRCFKILKKFAEPQDMNKFVSNDIERKWKKL